MKFKVLFLSFLALASCSTNPTIDATVKITNLQANSGGSGSIIKSGPSGSEVLTNRHVCEVVKNGGLVHSLSGKKAFVTGYKQSEIHDLCIVIVKENLGQSTKVSPTPPRFHERAVASGHPHLMPNIITEGYFSGKEIIRVVTGFKECTENDLKDPVSAFFCLVFGKIPLIKTYEAIAVSTLIQPGSSGSAIYGENGRIKAVVFAGAGDLGFTFAVPQEYVYEFVSRESKEVKVVSPITEVAYSANQRSTQELINEALELCRGIDFNNALCKDLKQATELSDLIKR